MGNANFDKNFKNYLNSCKEDNNIKSAIIVTDKQCVMCTINEMNFKKMTINDDSHINLINYLEDMIYPNNVTTGWESYKLHDAYIILKGSEVTINLPLSGNLSLNQASFLIDILGEICKFNLENGDIISINIMSANDYKEYRNHNLISMGLYVLSNLTEIYITQEEKIIGKTSFNSQYNQPKVYEKH